MYCLDEKTAPHRAGERAEDTIHDPPYHRPKSLSTCFLARQDDETLLALGSLLIYALGRTLPRRERETAWGLVAKWLSQLVDVRHGEQRGAA